MNNLIQLDFENGSIKLPTETVTKALIEKLESQQSNNLTNAPPIGEYWKEQGGFNAGLIRGENDKPDYWLIVPIDTEAEITDIEWGSVGEEEPEATNEYDGRANTIALVKSEHKHPAAEKIASLELNGFTDYYLPARRELAALYASVPELFEKKWHWSSTQYASRYAWSQHFSDGDQSYDAKDCKARARAVRRLTL